jgi:hypothetical protein
VAAAMAKEYRKYEGKLKSVDKEKLMLMASQERIMPGSSGIFMGASHDATAPAFIKLEGAARTGQSHQ